MQHSLPYLVFIVQSLFMSKQRALVPLNRAVTRPTLVLNPSTTAITIVALATHSHNRVAACSLPDRVFLQAGHRGSFRRLALHQVDAAGAHIALIGDSVAMVVHGHDTTLPITVDEMLIHCRAVARGARRVFRLGDMPFGSYENSKDDAVRTAIRFLKEGDVDAVKLEGRDGPWCSLVLFL